MEQNLELLKEMAGRLSYKPNHFFLVNRMDDETVLVSLRCPTLPNSMGKGVAGLTINNTVKLANIITPMDALEAFANVVADFELHEAAEFLRLDDRQIFLPHGWGDDTGGITWGDFVSLRGKFLRSLREFIMGPIADKQGNLEP